MGNYDEWKGYTLVADGAEAIDDIEIERFHVVADSPGSTEYVREFRYVIRNEARNRRHRVIPLLRLPRSIQQGMSVTGPSGEDLVHAPSGLCAEISREYFRHKLKTLNSRLKVFSAQIEENREASKDIFQPPIFTPEERERQTQALKTMESSFSTAIARVTIAIVDNLPGEARAEFLGADVAWRPDLDERDKLAILQSLRNRNPADLLEITQRAAKNLAGKTGDSSPEETEGLATVVNTKSSDLSRDMATLTSIVKLLSFMRMHREWFVPFVLLREPLGAKAEAALPSRTMIVHIVRQKIGRRLELSRLWGRYRYIVRFPLNTRADSTHFAIKVPSLRLLYDDKNRPKPLRGRRAVLQEFFTDDPHRLWEAREDTHYTALRRRDHIARYREILSGSSDIANNPGDPSIDLLFVVNAREGATTLILSGFLVGFSTLAAVELVMPGVGFGLPYVEAAVATGVSLAIFSIDRPTIRGPIVARMAIAFGLLVGTVLGLNALELSEGIGPYLLDLWVRTRAFIGW